MTPSNYNAVDLSYFRPHTDPLSDAEPTLPNRRPQMIGFIIAGYFLFYFYTYMLCTQIARRNRSCRQARDGKKGLSVEFEEEVLVVGVQGLMIREQGNRGGKLWEREGLRLDRFGKYSEDVRSGSGLFLVTGLDESMFVRYSLAS